MTLSTAMFARQLKKQHFAEAKLRDAANVYQHIHIIEALSTVLPTPAPRS